jgi:hypothetical protein
MLTIQLVFKSALAPDQIKASMVPSHKRRSGFARCQTGRLQTRLDQFHPARMPAKVSQQNYMTNQLRLALD